jgi:hypothetical protein
MSVLVYCCRVLCAAFPRRVLVAADVYSKTPTVYVSWPNLSMWSYHTCKPSSTRSQTTSEVLPTIHLGKHNQSKQIQVADRQKVHTYLYRVFKSLENSLHSTNIEGTTRLIKDSMHSLVLIGGIPLRSLPIRCSGTKTSLHGQRC